MRTEPMRLRRLSTVKNRVVRLLRYVVEIFDVNDGQHVAGDCAQFLISCGHIRSFDNRRVIVPVRFLRPTFRVQ